MPPPFPCPSSHATATNSFPSRDEATACQFAFGEYALDQLLPPLSDMYINPGLPSLASNPAMSLLPSAEQPTEAPAPPGVATTWIQVIPKSGEVKRTPSPLGAAINLLPSLEQATDDQFI